ncbi:hypothetical protein HO173_001295 [Letharia columbiana]|uniref:Uncharacterized protein n=1 Tax=Letharia columbiana TaxID=112416 RepID=A0A8H6L9E0_9LECA|nr:uncharacterized protein HO173_001295 [Letharia columbiana]KAF6240624.1 hypothetical protein HO173_001295 [Letharia columbiana]
MRPGTFNDVSCSGAFKDNLVGQAAVFTQAEKIKRITQMLMIDTPVHTTPAPSSLTVSCLKILLPERDCDVDTDTSCRPDHYCSTILQHTAEAIEKGRSRALVNDWVLSDQGSPLRPAVVGINMMALLSGTEKAEKLVVHVGCLFQGVKMIPPKGGCYNLLWTAAGDKGASSTANCTRLWGPCQYQKASRGQTSSCRGSCGSGR